MELTIDCQKRPTGSKTNALRRQGLIPAVLYGHQGTESVELTIPTRAAETLVKRAAVNSTLIQLNVPEMPWSGKALLREVQAHPWRQDLYHLSFFSVGGHASVEISLPLHFVGESVGVKQSGGTLDIVLNQLEVQCAPSDVPDSLEVDVAGLDVGDALHVNQLQLPKGVTAVGEGDRVVVSVLSTRSTAETAAES